MQLKLAIVENDEKHINALQALLKKWNTQHPNITLKIDVFLSGKPLINTEINQYHLIFLDIELDELSGLDIAHALRDKNFQGEFVFLTSYQEYVYEGYDVRALNYLLKPIKYEKLHTILSYVQEKNEETYFYYRKGTSILTIPYHDILFFSSCNQYVEIYTKTSTYKIRESIKNIIPHLPPRFVQCHRTAIVNLYYIDKLDGNEVYLTNQTVLPISKTFLQTMRKEFLNFLTKRL